MITKERLEELIEQGAIIYKITHNNRMDCRRLRSKMKIVDNSLYFNYKDPHLYSNSKWCYSSLYRLFETKEEAEWIIEFGCIERTERLELPTWEEFLELNRHCIEFHFITKEGDINYIVISDMYMHNDTLKPKEEWTIIIKDFDDEYIFEKPATKENYTLACRKAKELFLGEKK